MKNFEQEILQLLKDIKITLKNKSEDNYILENTYFLKNGNVLSLERKNGVSRFPYGHDGFTLWAYSSGYISINESTFYLVLPSPEGREPYLAFFLGEDKKGKYFPYSILGGAKNPEEKNIKRYTVYSKECVYYLLETSSFLSGCRIYVTEDKKVSFTVFCKNKTNKLKHIYLSSYMNCLFKYANGECMETKWFKKCSYNNDIFSFESPEDIDRHTHIDNYGIVKREFVLGNLSLSTNTTSKKEFNGSLENSLVNSISLKEGTLKKQKKSTLFTDTAIEGDINQYNLNSKEWVIINYVMAYAHNLDEYTCIKNNLPNFQNIEEQKNKEVDFNKNKYSSTDMLNFEFEGWKDKKVNTTIFNQFLKYVIYQTEYCGLAKNSGAMFLGVRDVMQQVEAALIWNPKACRRKILEVLSFIDSSGNPPRQYSIPPKNGVPLMDLRDFIDQGVWIISTIYTYLSYTKDYSILEEKIGYYDRKNDGVVLSSESNKIVIREKDGKAREYKLTKFSRSNQSNCYNQRPIVFKGDEVKAGDVIADGPSTSNGEIALGKNPLIGFMTWEGYNYEDAVLLSERLVRDDVYTSIHIEEYETEARDTKLGPEEITRDLPSTGSDAVKDLDENGIIRVGAEVRAGDILVGKVTPKGETELTAEERLLRAIFGEKAREVRDTSLKVPHGAYGIVVAVKTFTRENGDELSPGVNKSVRIYIAQKRKIGVGDKMAGRHGNKGVVSRVLPVEDMPFLPNGRPLDIVLNPLGVPSRMNIGQVLEIHLSLAAKVLGFNISTPVFDGADENDIMDTLDMANAYANHPFDDEELAAQKAEAEKNGEEYPEDMVTFTAQYKDVLNKEVFDYLSEHRDHRAEWKGVPIGRDGKVRLRDGRTGEYFDSPVTIGFMHYLKLHHLVDDKIHARSTGPYSLVTQQPLGGKAQFGGQRFGEMEVWALEAYGAAYTLQEILTVKSDDVVGRVKTYEAIIKGENIPEPGVPESFKVLLKELQSLALDVRVLDQDNNEVRLLESSEYEVTDFKKVLDEGNGYRRNSREEEAEYKAGGMSTVTLNEDGTEDAVDSDDEADFDMADDFDDDYGDGNSDEY